MQFLLVLLVFIPTIILAQPSDSQIIKDLTGKLTISVKLTEGPTKKVWSSTSNQYYWERGATIVEKAEIPEAPKATLIVEGTARYNTGSAKGNFEKFFIAENTYEGIPVPTYAELKPLYQSNTNMFINMSIINSIVSPKIIVRPDTTRGTVWHKPTSFTAYYIARYEIENTYTETVVQERVYEVRHYRDTFSAPFTRFLSTPAQNAEDIKNFETKTYNEDQLRKLKDDIQPELVFE